VQRLLPSELAHGAADGGPSQRDHLEVVVAQQSGARPRVLGGAPSPSVSQRESLLLLSAQELGPPMHKLTRMSDSTPIASVMNLCVDGVE
jgi:hypothetical protein